jgi:hypothetical protein
MPTAIGAYATTSSLKQLIGKTDSNDDTLIGLICDRVNAEIERITQRVVAPVSSATFTLDGDGSDRFFFPRGVRAITALEYASSTGGSYTAWTTTHYVVRPVDHERTPGFPGFWVVLTDIASPRRFPVGYGTVRMTATTGWAAIPDDVTQLALVIGQRVWNARQAGQQQLMATDEMGRPYIAQFFDSRDRWTLKQYSLPVLG